VDGGLDDAGQLSKLLRGSLQHSIEVQRAREASRHLTQHTLTLCTLAGLFEELSVLDGYTYLPAHTLKQRDQMWIRGTCGVAEGTDCTHNLTS
jgi:hypothetical protein